MRAGLQVLNDNNTIQIDDEFKAYTLHNKVVLTSARVAGATNDFNGVLYTVTSGLSTIVAVQCKTGSTLTRLQTVNSTSFSIGVATQGVGQQVILYLFTPGVNNQSTEGLQIFNDAGELVFDANDRNLICEKQISISVTSSTIDDYPLTPGREYAVIYSQWGGRIQNLWFPGQGGAAWDGFIIQSGPIAVPRTGGISIRPTSGYANASVSSSTPVKPPDADAYYAGGPILVADVTGL